MDKDLYQEAEALLRAKRDEWQRRLVAIQADRRRASAPLDPDFSEQAIQRENDGPLDALDERGRQELAAVESALERLAAGTYGRCVGCGESIGAGRLRAQPTATACMACASESSRSTPARGQA